MQYLGYTYTKKLFVVYPTFRVSGHPACYLATLLTRLSMGRHLSMFTIHLTFLFLLLAPSNLSLQDFKPFQLLSLCINVSLCLDCSTFSSLCSFLLFIVQVSAQMPLLRKFFLYLYIQRGPLSLLP